jgi:hypothetical protein
MDDPEPAAHVAHRHVPHPADLMARRELSRFNEWVTNHLALALGSVAGMWLAFILPLIAFEIPLLLKFIGLISSYWVQLWALFVLQRSANRADAMRTAKADADHLALSHIATVVDRIEAGPPS